MQILKNTNWMLPDGSVVELEFNDDEDLPTLNSAAVDWFYHRVVKEEKISKLQNYKTISDFVANEFNGEFGDYFTHIYESLFFNRLKEKIDSDQKTAFNQIRQWSNAKEFDHLEITNLFTGWLIYFESFPPGDVYEIGRTRHLEINNS